MKVSIALVLNSNKDIRLFSVNASRTSALNSIHEYIVEIWGTNSHTLGRMPERAKHDPLYAYAKYITNPNVSDIIIMAEENVIEEF